MVFGAAFFAATVPFVSAAAFGGLPRGFEAGLAVPFCALVAVVDFAGALALGFAFETVVLALAAGVDLVTLALVLALGLA